MLDNSATLLDRLQLARVLIAVGELRDAESEIAAAIEEDAEDSSAFGLLAKVKHMRGELSEAVACWARTHANGSANQAARMHLDAMYGLALDPERGAGEFLAIGHKQLVRKPMAYLALEEAFVHYVARRPAQAREHCQRVADRHRTRDRDLYKLAVLADAWIAQHAGDVGVACEVLEALGRERGFETDRDRICTLVDLYEVDGTPERLRAAVNICRFLERTDPVPWITGRLAKLLRRLGHDAQADAYEARHMIEFRRGMNRPIRADLIRVAARRYLPLRRLRAVACPDDDLPDAPSRAELLVAQALAVGGEQASLSPAFEALGGCHLGYAAEIAWLGGDAPRAAELWRAALAAEPTDVHIVRAALGDQDCGHLVVAQLTDELPVDRLTQTLNDALEMDPRDPRPWRALGLLLQSSAPARAQKAIERADAIEETRRATKGRIGLTLAAAVYRFVGRSKGLIHELWASRTPCEGGPSNGVLTAESILGNVTDDMRSGIQATFVSVREYARVTFPHLMADAGDYKYGFRITKDDEPSSGTSAGLPTALAFLSVFLQRSVHQDLAFTGAIVADAHDVLIVGPVSDLEDKVRGAYHRDLRGIVVPAANRSDVAASPLVPSAVAERFCHYVSRFDDAVKIAFGEDIFR